MKLSRTAAALLGGLALSGCVSVPQGPTVAVMPGAGKSLDQFRADGGVCQQFAQSAISGAGQAAQDNAAAQAAGGAAVGAVVGAMLGSATGQAGAGAAWGAGTGLMFGGAAAGNSGAASSYTLQRQFDVAYMQCMYTRGNQVPTRVARRSVATDMSPSLSYAPAGPARYNVPANASTPPPNTPPPAHYSVPPNALTPPPDTPAPQGYAVPGSTPSPRN